MELLVTRPHAQNGVAYNRGDVIPKDQQIAYENDSHLMQFVVRHEHDENRGQLSTFPKSTSEFTSLA